LRRYFKESLAIGAASFAAPFVGAILYAHYVSGWEWQAATICGIALSTTSVAVVYAVMIETGLNETDFGKLILAACFVTDLGTVVALGACFANLPERVEIVDRPEEIDRLLPVLDEMIGGGLIVVEDVHVVRYLHGPEGAKRATQ
jgi:Kef-type K+ transport system membrane component KefB